MPSFVKTFLALTLTVSSFSSAALAESTPPANPPAGPTTPVVAPIEPNNSAKLSSPLENATPVPTDLDGAIKEIHETLRRMAQSNGDILHEVTRTEQVYNNGQPMTNNSAITNSPMYQIYGGQTMQDALSHVVYLPARPHWLNNSFDQLKTFQSKLSADAAALKKILASPDCDSATRAQGMVLSDITVELGRDIEGIKKDIDAKPLSNAQVNVSSHKIADTISGMEKVAERIWREAPHKMKKK